MIKFNIPPFIGSELNYVEEAIKSHKICGDGYFTKCCSNRLEQLSHSEKALLTTSGTSALEMTAILCDIKAGDEVIMPSYTFVSTANAFVLRGAKIIFVDIRPDTMNIDENLIEAAISRRTKVIVPVHYAGVSCEMNQIMDIAKKHGLYVVEDAAQGIMSSYYNHSLGAIGDFGCLSFHETKNLSMGEGGALLIHDKDHAKRAEIIREKGTNRSLFYRGEIDKYSWVDVGSSYLPSELNAAYLWGQLEEAEKIIKNRMDIWNRYYFGLKDLLEKGRISVPIIPNGCKHNAHMFYIKVRDLNERSKLIQYMKEKDIMSVFHYIPLHTSKAGKVFGEFCGVDKYTTQESNRLIRLPLYYQMNQEDADKVIETIHDFMKS